MAASSAACSSSLAGATAASSSAEVAQCRICLEDCAVETLLAPCRCTGTGRFVHASCLQRWQDQLVGKGYFDERAWTCQSCCAPFSLRPSLPTASLSRRCLGSRSRPPEPPILERITTNPFFDASLSATLSARSRRQLLASMRPGCLVIRHPAAIQPVLRAEHWSHGVFLIAGMLPGQGHAGWDALVGVNLAGTPCERPRAGVDECFEELRAHLGHVPLRLLSGGPVQQSRMLVLVSISQRPTAPLPDLVRLVVGRPTEVKESEDVDPTTTSPHECAGALFGQPVDILGFLQREPCLGPLSMLAFQGHAVWSNMQLLSEIARGNWMLSEAASEDFTCAGLPANREATWDHFIIERTPTIIESPGSSHRWSIGSLVPGKMLKLPWLKQRRSTSATS